MSRLPDNEMAVTQSSTQPSRPNMSRLQTITVMVCMCASVFLGALEVTIVSTVLPTIASHFANDSGYTWVGTSYVLAYAASTPTWGKVSDIWGRKPILLIAATFFFFGSFICALVDHFDAFLVGRAVQGAGAAGMQTMVNICISDLFSQRDRGMYYGLTSLAWAVACAVGPIIGGAFTDNVSWRWCFWINLPITAVVIVLLIFTLKLPSPQTPVWEGLRAIDWLGSFLVVGGTLMLLVGLYLGGVYKPWDSSIVVCLIVFGTISGVLFVLYEWKFAKNPVIPVRLFSSRSSAAAYIVCSLHGLVFMGVAYYLPLYFQAVLLKSPLDSGLCFLPYILAITLSAAGTGIYIQLVGKYTWVVRLGSVIMALGTGLFIDLSLDISWSKMIIFQILCGIGSGMNFEGPLLAVQAVVPTDDVAAATTVNGFFRTLSASISVVIGGVVFQNDMNKQQQTLVNGLGSKLAKLFDGPSAPTHVGLIKDLPLDAQRIVRKAFLNSLSHMWIAYASFAGACVILSFYVGAHDLSRDLETANLGLKKNEMEGSENRMFEGEDVSSSSGR